ncbi:MAG: four helix bundle protein [Candidatus Kuenenbacteria bacterium]
MENFKKLKVWLKAHCLVLEVYKITKKFPKNEIFGLISQIRRAVISVAANIAEGSKRKTPKDRRHFLVMLETSLEEVKYYFLLSYELGYITKEKGIELTEKAREIGKMLTGLSRSIIG